jgi:hypothetical protein
MNLSVSIALVRGQCFLRKLNQLARFCSSPSSLSLSSFSLARLRFHALEIEEQCSDPRANFSFDRFVVKISDESINTYHTHTHMQTHGVSFFLLFLLFLSSEIFLLMRLSFVFWRSREDNETHRERGRTDPRRRSFDCVLIIIIVLFFFLLTRSSIAFFSLHSLSLSLSLCLPSTVFILRACTLATACVDTRAHTR